MTLAVFARSPYSKRLIAGQHLYGALGGRVGARSRERHAGQRTRAVDDATVVREMRLGRLSQEERTLDVNVEDLVELGLCRPLGKL